MQLSRMLVGGFAASLTLGACSEKEKPGNVAEDTRGIARWAEKSFEDVVAVRCPENIEPYTDARFYCVVERRGGDVHPVAVTYTKKRVEWTWEPVILTAEKAVALVDTFARKEGTPLTAIDCGSGTRRLVYEAPFCTGVDSTGTSRSVGFRNGVDTLRPYFVESAPKSEEARR